jgi:uncharacterized protein (UPF0548 family)
MFLLKRPSAHDIDRFVRASLSLPHSYSPVGLVADGRADAATDDMRSVVGHGEAEFVRACDALATWQHFAIGWVELYPASASYETGTVVAILIRHLGFWSLNGCRVVYVVGDRQAGRRFGFAYGTLTNHAEAGEELFEVLIDPQTEQVTYHVRAVSWPNSMVARVGQPIVRLLQARFRRDSAAAMRRAVGGHHVA